MKTALNPVTQATLGSTEIYNPQTKTFSAGPSTTPKSDHTATLLQRPATTATLASSLNPSAAGQKITVTATISTTDGVAATGSVTFLDGTTVLATVPLPLSQKGIATFSLSSLTVGSHSLAANYSGDIAHGKSTTPILVQNVKTQATTTALRSSPNPSKDGELVTFTATVTASSGTPTGSVIFRNNGTELQTIALTGNTAVFSTSSLGPGSNAITATYSGDANFASSGSQVLTQNVSKLPSTISLASNPNPAQYGQDVLFTATVTSSDGAPTGTVVFKDRNAVLQTVPVVSGVAPLTVFNLRVGSHSITGTYSGDLIHAGVTSALVSQQIDPALSATTLTSSLNPSFYGQNVTFNATVEANAGTPTGTVTFSDNLTPLGTVNLNAGVATFSTNALTGGTHQVRATYNGDGNHAKSVSSPLPQTVNKVPTTTALSSSLNPSKVGQGVIFTATVSSSLGGSPAGIVTFLDGMNVLGTQSLSAGTAALTVSTLKAEVHNITASYGGSMNFTGSGSSVLVQNVQPVKATTTTSVTSSANPSAPGQLVTFTATVTGTGGNPTGTVTFQDRANVLGTGVLSGGIANFGTSSLGIGTHSITAVYGGAVNFNGSRSPALTQTVNGLFPTSVSLTAGPNPSMTGQTVVFTATVRSQGGGMPAGTITLSEGSTIYGSSPLTNGVGRVSTSSLSAGMHVIAATYGGDANHSGATSPTVQQQVNAP